jgi:hypothetical protein
VSFVGRTIETTLIEETLDGLREERLVVLSGVAGIGKTTLLSRAREVALDRGWSCGSLDLATLLGDGDGAGHFPESVARALAGHVVTNAPDRVARMEALEKSLKTAAAELIESRSKVSVRQFAALGGHIQDVQIDIHDATVAATVALQRYRRDVAKALAVSLEGCDASRVLLTIDTTEVVSLFDVAAEARHGGGLTSWFTGELLHPLVTGSGIPVVIAAGRETLAFPENVRATYAGLHEWSAGETRQHAQNAGLDGVVAASVFEHSDGHPLWSDLIAQECVAATAAGIVTDSSWLARVSAERPAQEWVPRLLLGRVPATSRDLVIAAAVLRAITREAIETLVGEVTDARWDELVAYSFIQRSVGAPGVAERRMHALFRQATIAFMRHERPERLSRLHQSAASYFARQGVLVDAHYHRFASADWSSVDDWFDDVDQAIGRYEYESASLLIDAVMNAAGEPGELSGNPRLVGLAHEFTARLAEYQDRIDDALQALGAARESYRRAGSPADESDVLAELARLSYRTAEAETGSTQLQESLRLAKQARDHAREGRALAAMASYGSATEDKRALLEKALTAYRGADRPHQVASTLRRLGDLAETDAERGRLYDLAAKVFEEEHDCVLGRAENAEAAAKLAGLVGDLGTQLEHLASARDTYQSSDTTDEHGRISRYMAHVELRRGRFDAARPHFDDALVAFRASQNVVEEAVTNRSLAHAIAEWQGISQAFDALTAAQEGYDRVNDVHGIATVMELLADLQARQKQWPLEQGPYEHALRAYRQARDVRAEVRVLKSMAMSAGVFWGVSEIMEQEVSRARIAEAQGYLLDAHALQQRHWPDQTGEVALRLAETYRYLGDPGKAKFHLNEARVSFERRGMRESAAWATREIAGVFASEGDYPMALQIAEEAMTSIDRVHGQLIGYLHQDVGDYRLALGDELGARRSYALARAALDEGPPEPH